MNKMLFLVSGNGGLLKFVYSCIEKNILRDHKICAVIGDRDCAAVDFAKNKGIYTRVVKYNTSNRKDLLNTMRDIEFDVAITTIYRILDLDIVKSFEDKLINVHPSLLPAFGGGFHAVEDAMKHGVKFIGTTVHYVNEEVDAGKIIAQSVMPVNERDPIDHVLNNQFRAWCFNLLNVLLRRIDNYAVDKAENYQQTLFNPTLCFDTNYFDEKFWSDIKID